MKKLLALLLSLTMLLSFTVCSESGDDFEQSNGDTPSSNSETSAQTDSDTSTPDNADENLDISESCENEDQMKDFILSILILI